MFPESGVLMFEKRNALANVQDKKLIKEDASLGTGKIIQHVMNASGVIYIGCNVNLEYVNQRLELTFSLAIVNLFHFICLISVDKIQYKKLHIQIYNKQGTADINIYVQSVFM